MDCNPLEASVAQVATFLTLLFSEGRQVSTIRNYRSAIGSVHRGFADGSSLSNNELISQLLRGMFNRRPPEKRLTPSWSINDVLQTLARPPYEPLHNATLEHLTHKTVFLVAAASARRRSELQALTTRDGFIRFEQGGVRLLTDPQFLAKNQSSSFTPGDIFLPELKEFSSVAEDKLWCPVRALKWYLERTKVVRTSDKLFVIPRSPYSAAAKDTISKWLIRLISPHASQGENVRAHDIRGHATSKAWFARVPLEDIMKAAAWKTPSTFVSSYLIGSRSAESAFASSVLRAPVLHRPAPPRL